MNGRGALVGAMMQGRGNSVRGGPWAAGAPPQQSPPVVQPMPPDMPPAGPPGGFPGGGRQFGDHWAPPEGVAPPISVPPGNPGTGGPPDGAPAWGRQFKDQYGVSPGQGMQQFRQATPNMGGMRGGLPGLMGNDAFRSFAASRWPR